MYTLLHRSQGAGFDSAVISRSSPTSVATEWAANEPVADRPDERLFEFKDAGDVAFDPIAVRLLSAAEWRRLGAVPLSSTGGPVIAVAEPSEERLDAVRAVSGRQVRFVLVSHETLSSLLGSRILSALAQPSPDVAQPASPLPPAPSPLPPASPLTPPHPAPASSGPLRMPQAVATEARPSHTELDRALEATREELRLAREELAAARAENDRHSETIRILASELAASRARTEEMHARLERVRAVLGGEPATLGPPVALGGDERT